MPTYGLIGGSLSHSFSPKIHRMLGDYPYELYPLAESALPAFMQNNTLDGFNVTLPFKLAVMPFLDSLSEQAKAIGSVNTVVRCADGRLHGDNTDYQGFARMLGNAALFSGQKALVLGTGGASKAVTAVLRDKGILPVLISRSGDNHYGNIAKHSDAALIVNTTPVGMYPEMAHSPLPLDGFPACRLVLDLVYNPYRTRLLLDAERLQKRALGGLTMLVAQAEAAARLWGQVDDADRVDDITHRLFLQTQNIALIGMPGAGKSSVAQALSQLTGRPVVDTDQQFHAQTGMAPGDFILTHGEEAFRPIETEVLQEAAKQSGNIIATGGGIVTVPRNLDILRQNSRIVLLQRNTDALSLSGRPLSQAQGIDRLYAARAPLYAAWSEHRFTNHDILQTAQAIREELL